MSIPHDPASVFVYILLVVAGYLIWRGGRSKRRDTTGGQSDG